MFHPRHPPLNTPTHTQNKNKERAALIARRVEAMQTRDTGARLAAALEAMKEARAVLAAKCALRSINLSA